MAGLWRYSGNVAKEGKYLVQRRDGTIPEWAWFVMGQRDPAAPTGLRAYADKCEELKFDPQYVADVRKMADEWEASLPVMGVGDPDAPPHRTDDPGTVAKMANGNSA